MNEFLMRRLLQRTPRVGGERCGACHYETENVSMKYNEKIVTAFLVGEGLPAPVYEVEFHPGRKWRWDLCWPDYKVAMEVQGGIFVQGRHSRGAAMLKEWEKLNTAASNGWRVLFVQPKDLCLVETARLIERTLRGVHV